MKILSNITLPGILVPLFGNTFTSRGLFQKTVAKAGIMATGKRFFQLKSTKEYLKQLYIEEVKYSAPQAYQDLVINVAVEILIGVTTKHTLLHTHYHLITLEKRLKFNTQDHFRK